MNKNLHENISAPTSEEEYILNNLVEWGIDFEREVKITDLVGDTKSYRVVDFYLVDYKIYIEYFGMYNSTKEIRNEYDKKVQVYIANKMPTIFLYPHELGFLEYAFHKKSLRVLKAYNFKRELLQYKKDRFNNKLVSSHIWRVIPFITTILIFCILFMDTGLAPNFEIVLAIFLAILGLASILRELSCYIKYVRKEQ